MAAGVSALVLVLVALLCRVTFRGPTDVWRMDAHGQPVAFPYRDPAASTKAPMAFAFHLRRSALAPGSFTVVPDDHLLSISVNGRDLSLADVPRARLDDWEKGFSYPLGRALADGDNDVVVRVENHGGPGGLDVHADASQGLPLAELVVAALAATALIASSMRLLGIGWGGVALGAGAVLLRFAYLWVTPITVREHDALQHIDYFHFLREHHALPRAVDGWSYYHPPLYYVVSCLIQIVCEAIGFGRHEGLVILQLQSVAYELGFCVFTAATIRLWMDHRSPETSGRRLASRPGLTLLCVALVLFWPTSVMHAVRIGNDDMVYLWFGGVMYFASRWWLAGRDAPPRDFVIAAGFAALGVITKTSSLILFVVLGIMLLLRLVARRERKLGTLLGYFVPLTILGLASTGLALHETIGALLAGQHPEHYFVGNADRAPAALTLDNRAAHFAWMDLPTFLNMPFTSAWDDAMGRQYFWNYLLKTAMFGEWQFTGAWVVALAKALSWTCLAMWPLVLVGALWRRRSELVDEVPLSLVALFLLVGVAMQRLEMPNFHGDFRYVFPILLQLSWWYVVAVIVFTRRGWKRLGETVAALGWLTCGLSVAFVVAVVASGT